MSTVVYTTGTWRPNAGSEDAFIAAWQRFAGWASSMPGAGRLQLVRDNSDPGRFVSFGDWHSIEQVRDWKRSPEFRERMARVLQHIDSFEPLELDLVATADSGTTRRAADGAHQV
jgi:heme-degrading monooxygenase HmoA